MDAAARRHVEHRRGGRGWAVAPLALSLVMCTGLVSGAAANPAPATATSLHGRDSTFSVATGDAKAYVDVPSSADPKPSASPGETPGDSSVMLSGSDGSDDARAELIFSVIVFVLAGLGWGAAMYWLVRGRRRGHREMG